LRHTPRAAAQGHDRRHEGPPGGPSAGGALALFDPGQQTLLHRHIIAPEGRIHFAGEHASLAHAWIQGAIESGLRCAWEVHSAPA